MIKVSGKCPMGCGESLFLGEGEHLTCSAHSCPDPTAADHMLFEAEVAYRGMLSFTTFRADEAVCVDG